MPSSYAQSLCEWDQPNVTNCISKTPYISQRSSESKNKDELNFEIVNLQLYLTALQMLDNVWIRMIRSKLLCSLRHWLHNIFQNWEFISHFDIYVLEEKQKIRSWLVKNCSRGVGPDI